MSEDFKARDVQFFTNFRKVKFKSYNVKNCRLSQDEMIKIKQATRLESYASYSEFVRRTVLIEAEKAINSKRNKEEK